MKSRFVRWFTAAAALAAATVSASAALDDLSLPGHRASIVVVAKPQSDIPSRRFDVTLDAVPRVKLAPLDHVPLLAEDQANGAAHQKKLRVSVPQHLILQMRQGRWLNVKGGRLWTVEIEAPGAHGIRVHFSGMNMPRGAELYMYQPQSPEPVVGPYCGRGPVGDGELWAGSVFSDVVRVEYFEPAGAGGGNRSRPFVIDDIQHIYRDISPRADRGGGGGGAGPCHNDTPCDPVWSDVADSVARLFFIDDDIGWVCSGQLIRTVAADETPYFLTARHCISSNSVAATAEFLWNYERTGCNSGAVNPGTPSLAAQMTATYSSSDETLLLINGELPAGVFWSGWTNSAVTSGTAATCIHHPAGDYKRISFATKYNTPNCGGSSTNFVLADWNDGVTEGGSSGAGFWRDSDQLLFATLTCGGSDCAFPTFDDFYGRFDQAYNNLFATHLNAGTDDAFEDNDTCSTAVSPGSGNWTGLIVKSTDEDWYRFTIPSGASLSIDLGFTDANGDIDMSLTGGCGESVLAVAQSATDNESINWVNLTGSTATVFVRVYLASDTRNTYDLSATIGAPTGPVNDLCSNALLVSDGGYAIDNNGATTDGPNEPGGCSFFAYSQIDVDIWYRYVAPCTGETTVSLCGSAFDTKMAVYGDDCPTSSGSTLACNDDACATQSVVAFNAVAGEAYLIRIGGYQGDQGTGTMNITCTAACPADLNGDDVVNVLDLLVMLGAWGPNPGHAADLNSDGVVNVLDLLDMLGDWGSC